VPNRRRDDPRDHAPPAGAEASESALPEMAVAWLRELLQDEFGAPAAEAAALADAPAEDAADAEARRVWRREWLRHWRRLQLPEQLAAYRDALEEARTAEGIHAAFAQHAASIVGAYFCLVFTPGEGGVLAPLPLPDAETPRALWMREPRVARSEVVARPDLTPDSTFEGMAPLFEETRAVALLVTPYAGGTAVLVERRQEREFETLDHQLPELLAAEAGVALRRLVLLEGIGGSDASAPAPAERIERVRRHAHAGIALGLEITLVRVRMDEGPGAEEGLEALMRHCGSVIRREARGAGPALRVGERDFLVVLNGGTRAAEALVRRIQLGFGAGARLEASIQQPAPDSLAS
jgi:hypothetical protein